MDNNDKYNMVNLKNPVSRLAYVMAKITLRFNVLFSQFIELYKYHLVMLAQKEDSEYSIVELAARTGLDRRYVSKALKDEALKKTRSKVTLVLQQLRHQCQQNKTTLVSKYGGKYSFKSLCEQVSPGGLTHHAIAKELLRQGHILDCGKKYQVLNMTDPLVEETLADHFFARRILNQIVARCIRNNTRKIDKQMQFIPLVEALEINGLDPKSIGDELVSVGCLKDCGDYYVLLNWRFIFSTEIGNFSLIAREINRFADTALSNTDKKVRKDKKLQRSMYSNQINPKHFDVLNKKLERLYNDNNKKTFDLLSSYESDVPRGTFPMFGITVYLFEEIAVKSDI